ncbi:MAG: conjugative transfer relaxase/helicase TraI domain-containing protein [Candidatus Phlomobacter fragariae]
MTNWKLVKKTCGSKANTALAKKVGPVIAETGRLSTINKFPEILLQIVNEKGIQRGNNHLPVGIYTGNIDFEGVSYHGAKDGRYIILKKGDESAEPKTYQTDQLQTVPDNAIAIEITHETDKHNE